jgi:GTPase
MTKKEYTLEEIPYIIGISDDGELFEGQDNCLENNVNILSKTSKIEVLNSLIKRCEKEKLKLLQK